MTMDPIFPAQTWQDASPDQVGMHAGLLDEARRRLDELVPDTPYRVAIVRHGYLVAEWLREMAPGQSVHIASAMKSVLSNMLGIAIDEGRIGSADDLVVEHFPEMIEVTPGSGPKEGRHAFEANRGATLRHLICNVSGFLKPGEAPGEVFNYQTTGMCLLTHCIERAYGLYDIDDPEGSVKIGRLFKEKIADRIGAGWEYSAGSQKMAEGARVDIFGWGTSIRTTLGDHARMGWLWCNHGMWQGEQIIPGDWLRQSVCVNRFVREQGEQVLWRYGHGFWSNESGQLWPDLPADGFTSWGAGGNYAICFPSLSLTIAMNPVNFAGQTQPYETMSDAWRFQQQVLSPILDSIH